jgi:hypothetical protein
MLRIIYKRIAGLDVHKKSVVATRMRVVTEEEVEQETKTIGRRLFRPAQERNQGQLSGPAAGEADRWFCQHRSPACCRIALIFEEEHSKWGFVNPTKDLAIEGARPRLFQPLAHLLAYLLKRVKEIKL